MLEVAVARGCSILHTLGFELLCRGWRDGVREKRKEETWDGMRLWLTSSEVAFW
jgi:hypothetical protein